jgi:hypothetical protein
MLTLLSPAAGRHLQPYEQMFAYNPDTSVDRLCAETQGGAFESVGPRALNLQLPLALCRLESEFSEVAFAKRRINQGAVIGLIDREPLGSESRAKLVK